MKFRNLDIEGNCNEVWCSNDDAHIIATSPPAFCWSIDMPNAVHEHVRQQYEVAGEVNAQPLSETSHCLDAASHNGLIFIDA